MVEMLWNKKDGIISSNISNENNDNPSSQKSDWRYFINEFWNLR